MRARDHAEIAGPQSLFWWRGVRRAYSLFAHLLLAQQRFVNGKGE